jgi:Helix-turn-helix domain
MVELIVDDIFDERAAGVLLGGTDRPISPRTFQRWRQRGLGPKFVRIGNQIRYRRSDLETWLSSRIAQSTADRIEAPS